MKRITAQNILYTAWTVGSLWFLTSCNPARYAPEGSYLLSRNRVVVTDPGLSEDQVKSYILQRPNKKIVGFRFHLSLYNLSNIQKERWPHNWLRKIGEEPVIYNPALTSGSRDQLARFLENKGYYHAVVQDSVQYRRRNARVTYTVQAGVPTRIRDIRYFFEDTGLVSQVLPDTLNTLVKRGGKFDKDVLQNERVRIETRLKERGYYRFAKEYIYYTANLDTRNNTVDLLMGFKEFVEGKPDPKTKVKQHPVYRFGKITMIPDYGSFAERGQNGLTFDTVVHENLNFVSHGRPTLRPGVIADFNFIRPGELYKQSNVSKTYRSLSELGPVRYTNIVFREADTLHTPWQRDHILDGQVELTRKKVQSYQTEIAGTNSGGDLGIRGNLSYQNLNLLRGAEVFNVRITGALEALKNRSKNEYSSMREIGIDGSMVFPKFFSPFRMRDFVSKYTPKTSISATFNYQSRPDYTRSIANGSFSYKWNGSSYVTHTLWPIELNYVQIDKSRSDPEFLDSIQNTPLGYSFEDHLVNVARYGFELNNQRIGKTRDFGFVRFNIESAGNLVNAYMKVTNREQIDGQYHMFNVPYFQYLRGDLDLRYYNVIDKQNRIAYRLYMGMGYSYGNSQTLPFEKKFFSGGPNSIRAWSSRDLGPGSDTTTSTFFNFPNKNGDIKLEANLEYRFKVIWKMEAAIFVDAGNIWALRPEADKPGADFAWNRFYKEIAIGSGLGARFDFSFFLLRVDFGLKVRDPAMPEDSRWLPVFKDFSLGDLHWNFGIGYPF